MTKTRIKCIVRADGTKEYTAQYRMFPLIWQDFSDVGMSWQKAFRHQKCPIGGNTLKLDSMEFCKLVVDMHFELLENERKEQEAKKIASVEYIKYP